MPKLEYPVPPYFSHRKLNIPPCKNDYYFNTCKFLYVFNIFQLLFYDGLWVISKRGGYFIFNFIKWLLLLSYKESSLNFKIKCFTVSMAYLIIYFKIREPTFIATAWFKDAFFGGGGGRSSDIKRTQCKNVQSNHKIQHLKVTMPA